MYYTVNVSNGVLIYAEYLLNYAWKSWRDPFHLTKVEMTVVFLASLGVGTNVAEEPDDSGHVGGIFVCKVFIYLQDFCYIPVDMS
jgi:hypothetical protein